MEEPEKKVGTADERLPYESPAVISEEVFETLALSCAQAGDDCFFDPVS